MLFSYLLPQQAKGHSQILREVCNSCIGLTARIRAPACLLSALDVAIKLPACKVALLVYSGNTTRGSRARKILVRIRRKMIGYNPGKTWKSVRE
jgi:hypothetical protein